MDAQLRSAIIARDGGCIARFATALYASRAPEFKSLPDPGPCRSKWGEEISPFDLEKLTIEEVKHELRMAVKAGYALDTSVAVCPGHHVEGRGPGAKWCTKKVVRERVRAYLARVSPMTAPP